MKISVCCPSYKRPKVETFDYIPYVRCYVSEDEREEYLKANPGFEDNFIFVDPKHQGNVARIRNYIIKEELKENDAVLLIDDDLQALYYVEDRKAFKISPELLPQILKKYTQMAKDMGAYLWGVNVNPDPQSFKEFTPFNTTKYIGSPFSVFLKGNDCWYDERLPLKEDYDMTLQQLNKHRVVLRVNHINYVTKQSVNPGGCATIRNHSKEEQQFRLLQSKWGSKIVYEDRGDKSNKSKKVKVRMDYNPIIRPPIRGV